MKIYENLKVGVVTIVPTINKLKEIWKEDKKLYSWRIDEALEYDFNG